MQYWLMKSEPDVYGLDDLKKEGKELFEPLYTKDDAATAMEHFIGIGYRRRRTIAQR